MEKTCICPNCQAEVDASSPFCGKCGTRIIHRFACPECGNEVLETDTFCNQCGHQISALNSTCPKCGAALTEDNQFCPSCGAPINPLDGGNSALTPAIEKELSRAEKKMIAKENARKKKLFDKAMKWYDKGRISSVQKAMDVFKDLDGFQNAGEMVDNCAVRITEIRKSQRKAKAITILVIILILIIALGILGLKMGWFFV